VRDAAGQQTDGFELLRLPQLILQCTLAGQAASRSCVMSRTKVSTASPPSHSTRVGLDCTQRCEPSLAEHLPAAMRWHMRRAARPRVCEAIRSGKLGQRIHSSRSAREIGSGLVAHHLERGRIA